MVSSFLYCWTEVIANRQHHRTQKEEQSIQRRALWEKTGRESLRTLQSRYIQLYEGALIYITMDIYG